MGRLLGGVAAQLGVLGPGADSATAALRRAIAATAWRYWPE